MANTYDLGAVTSYAIAVEHGYEGTEAQFAEELTGATAAARAAAEDASDAEAYAVGKRGGVDVGSTDPAYHNNAKYWAQNASGANLAQAFSTSTAYAVGDYVLYNNKLYRFTTAHSAGEWNSSQVAEVKTMDEVSSIKDDLSETVKFVPQTLTDEQKNQIISNIGLDNLLSDSIKQTLLKCVKHAYYDTLDAMHFYEEMLNALYPEKERWDIEWHSEYGTPPINSDGTILSGEFIDGLFQPAQDEGYYFALTMPVKCELKFILDKSSGGLNFPMFSFCYRYENNLGYGFKVFRGSTGNVFTSISGGTVDTGVPFEQDGTVHVIKALSSNNGCTVDIDGNIYSGNGLNGNQYLLTNDISGSQNILTDVIRLISAKAKYLWDYEWYADSGRQPIDKDGNIIAGELANGHYRVYNYTLQSGDGRIAESTPVYIEIEFKILNTIGGTNFPMFSFSYLNTVSGGSGFKVYRNNNGRLTTNISGTMTETDMQMGVSDSVVHRLCAYVKSDSCYFTYDGNKMSGNGVTDNPYILGNEIGNARSENDALGLISMKYLYLNN